ncbi:hypothetical protein ACLQ2D_34020 [Streptomyces sp. DT199]|uniref:hypothetical protein n=1 Tax=Streptomyces TaxID=1883 RepID=UPI0037241C56
MNDFAGRWSFAGARRNDTIQEVVWHRGWQRGVPVPGADPLSLLTGEPDPGLLGLLFRLGRQALLFAGALVTATPLEGVQVVGNRCGCLPARLVFVRPRGRYGHGAGEGGADAHPAFPGQKQVGGAAQQLVLCGARAAAGGGLCLRGAVAQFAGVVLTLDGPPPPPRHDAR